MTHLILMIVFLIQMESGGNNFAVGDGGRSLGCLQIGAAVIEDVNRVYSRKYTWTDAVDRNKSREICALYLLHWGKEYQRETGNEPTPDIYARIWCGGPYGWKKKSTREYGWRMLNLVRQYEQGE